MRDYRTKLTVDIWWAEPAELKSVKIRADRSELAAMPAQIRYEVAEAICGEIWGYDAGLDECPVRLRRGQEDSARTLALCLVMGMAIVVCMIIGWLL